MALDDTSRNVKYPHMERARILRTVEDVVAAFGSVAEAAEWAGVGCTAVHNWIARAYIPPGWHYRLQQHLAPRGFHLAGSVFGETDERPSHRPDSRSAA